MPDVLIRGRGYRYVAVADPFPAATAGLFIGFLLILPVPSSRLPRQTVNRSQHNHATQ